jgi:hypothetical protein
MEGGAVLSCCAVLYCRAKRAHDPPHNTHIAKSELESKQKKISCHGQLLLQEYKQK